MKLIQNINSLKLIQEMNHTIRDTTDPVRAAIAEMNWDDVGDGSGEQNEDQIIDELSKEVMYELRDNMKNTGEDVFSNEDEIREMIGMYLENMPGYDYESESAERMINAIMANVRAAK